MNEMLRQTELDLIYSDVNRIMPTGKFRVFKRYILPRGEMFRYNVWLRITHACKSNRILKYTIGVLSYLILRHYEYKYGIHANSNIEIGRGLRVVHGDGVYLNCRSIGDNFTVYQNVTIGSLKGGIPVIGNNVTIYTGAVVVGNITIGDGSIIGANSYVDKDVSPNTIVVGCPAKTISPRK